MSSMAAKLKIAGIWVGVVEVELENWTVTMLREEISKRSNVGTDSIKLIFAGRILKDGDGGEKLSQLGVENNSKILSTRASIEEGKSLKQTLMTGKERDRKLARLKAAVAAMSTRHGEGSLPIEDFNLEVEYQSGQRLQFSEADREAIMMGLMLHSNGKGLMKKQMFKDALEVLTMAEEAFDLCDPKSIELVDNVPLLQIDMVRCYFMLSYISLLSVAGERLNKAREGLERAHGKDTSRLRLLQGGHSSELALYLRLELLEGVVAYHNGEFDESRRFLNSAQLRFSKLEVPDEALSIVMSMGFSENDAKTALRMRNQDVESAINFLVEEKEKKKQKRIDDHRRIGEMIKQKMYGMTPLNKPVNLERLKELVSLGFDWALAAESLRRNENDIDKSLDDLTNPETIAAIRCGVDERIRRRNEACIEMLVSKGFKRSLVVEGLLGDDEQAMDQLLRDVEAYAAKNNGNHPRPTNAAVKGLNIQDNLGSNSDDTGGPSAFKIFDKRDIEMEDEFAKQLEERDALSDYDTDVTNEGEVINEYLALLDSVDSTETVNQN